DYASNVGLYPKFQDYFRTHQPPLLAVWGKNDPFFLPSGAEAFKRDIPAAIVRLFDTGHFALETHAPEIAEAIRDLLRPLNPYRSPGGPPGVQSSWRSSEDSTASCTRRFRTRSPRSVMSSSRSKRSASTTRKCTCAGANGPKPQKSSASNASDW